VTGAAGFLGRRLLHAFALRDDDVLGVDLARPPDCVHTTRVQDCLDLFRFGTERFDLVVHCAAVVGGRQQMDSAPLAVATNCALDAWFFRWLELSGTSRAVYFSSSAVYPTVRQNGEPAILREFDVNPRAPLLEQPDGAYGWAKLTGELLAGHCPAEVLVVRPFSGYAEDQADTYPFPAFLRRARHREDPFPIWGGGLQVRDWIHADDIVAAVLAGLEAGVTGPVNLCTGRPTSMVELVSLFCDAAGYDPELTFLRDAPAGVQYRVGDPFRMTEFYVPKYSLEDGVRRAWASDRFHVAG
jgi:nucleoside-diphosphate-sugar epimerase